jgi:hypothetical protein
MTNELFAEAMPHMEQFDARKHVGADRLHFVAEFLCKLPPLKIPDDVDGDACRTWIGEQFARRRAEANAAYEAQERFAASHQ